MTNRLSDPENGGENQQENLNLNFLFFIFGFVKFRKVQIMCCRRLYSVLHVLNITNFIFPVGMATLPICVCHLRSMCLRDVFIDIVVSRIQK